MPEVSIKVGGRPYIVACQEGEEVFLESAAAKLDTEAMSLSTQVSRVPESRMLLMSGLLLADKTAAAEDKIKVLEAELAKLKKDMSTATAKTVEVPVVPESVVDTLAELSARAEALADQLDEKLSPADPE